MVDEELRLVIDPSHDRNMPGTEDSIWNALKNSGTLGTPFIPIRTKRMLRYTKADAIVPRLPGTAGIQAIVKVVVENNIRPFDRVPGIPGAAINGTVALINMPIGGGADDIAGRFHECYHIAGKRGSNDSCTYALIKEVFGKEQIPLPIFGILKRMGVDRETFLWKENLSHVTERPGGMIRRGQMQTMAFIAGAACRRVIHIKEPGMMDNFGCPVSNALGIP
jgi:hypothetical protein